MKLHTTALLCTQLALACSYAQAEAYDPAAFLLGDWNGARTQLHDNGIDFSFTYTNELAYNTQGGDEHKGTYADQLMLDTRLDLQKLAGWQGAELRFTLTNRNGENLNAEADLNTLLSPQEIYGYGSVTRLVQLYYQHKLYDDRLTLKIGRMPMSGDVFPFDCKFQNLTFCGTVPGYITPNWFTWPVSQWGASASAKVADDWTVSTALYQVNPSFTKNSQGLNFGSPHGTTGHLAVGEVAWTPTVAGLAGSYRVGVWNNTGDFSDVYEDIDGQPIALTGNAARQHDSATGYYALAEQKVYQDPTVTSRSLSVFANFIQSDRDVSSIERIWQVGAYLKSPFASRPADEIGFALGRLEVNHRSARRLRQEGAAHTPDVEYPMELYYGVAVTPAIILRPNVQWVNNPGGIEQDRSVVVFGLKSIFSF